jgi:hypothetical protein
MIVYNINNDNYIEIKVNFVLFLFVTSYDGARRFLLNYIYS